MGLEMKMYSKKIEITVEFPDGFEPTDKFVSSYLSCTSDGPCIVGTIILQKSWQPPAFIQLIADALGGCWVYLGECLGGTTQTWYITNREPVRVDHKTYRSNYSCVTDYKSVSDFNIWFGTAFTPPKEPCVHVKPQQAGQ